MRILLVGSPGQRASARIRLEEAAEIAGEFDTLAAARASGVEVDGILMLSSSGALDEDDDPALEEPLTPREREVLARLADGLSNKAIGQRLGISDQTVKFHVATIYGKLRATNRADAVRKGLRRGLIEI
jgi:DNA-binding NarL/FixJ family response regulator